MNRRRSGKPPAVEETDHGVSGSAPLSLTDRGWIRPGFTWESVSDIQAEPNAMPPATQALEALPPRFDFLALSHVVANRASLTL